tara:strand:+ start:5339 stop:6517 length:1179 start_codon:yes stop_codon:yes gene_type:complete
MKSEYDIVVVGGGPAGSMAAKYAAENGAKVCVLEKTRDIGYPVRCGEAVGHDGVTQFVEMRDSWIAEKINSCTLVSPDGTKLNVPFANETGYILNRRIFDYDLSRLASNAGAEIYTKSQVTGLLFSNEKVSGVSLNHLGENKQIKAKIIIGADGVDTRIGRWAGLKTTVKMKDMESCVQYSVSNVDITRNNMTMYVGKNYAPGGYLWIFPKGDSFANIGLGISGKYSKHKSAKKYLDEFLERQFPNASIHTTMCGGVPVAYPIKKPVTDNVIVVGDAAHHINPVTGGGITPAMKSGMIGGIIAADAIKVNDMSESYLNRYTKAIEKDFTKRHHTLYKIKEAISQLSDDDINAISNKIDSIPEDKRSLRKVFMASMLKKPSLVIDVMRIFTGL